MEQALTERTRVAPNYGAETTHASAVTNPPSPLLAGLMAWLPAIVILLGMPVLALVTTKYALVPSMKRVFAQEAVATQGNPVFLVKIPLNASGAMGAHSGFRSLGLVGADSTLKDKVDQNKAKLMNLAASDLSGKKVSDLDKPGELDAVRARLRADFNRALGGPVVQEVFIAVYP